MNKIVDSIAIVILAAGKGTRMKSDKAKVLHPLLDRPMIVHVLDTAVEIAGKDIVVVVGNQAETVKKIVSKNADVAFAFQMEQNGTGDAVRCAIPELPDTCRHVVILSGDVPLIQATTVRNLISDHIRLNNDITVLGVCLDKPFGYGRIVSNGSGGVLKIVEETDADELEKKINTVNSGVYCVKKDFLTMSLSLIGSNNSQNEIYLTDIVEVASNYGKKIGLRICDDQSEVLGVNTPEDLLNVETIMMGS